MSTEAQTSLVKGDFHGKVAMVTGAASGIGRAIALAFAREGAFVAVGDRNEAGLGETEAMIGTDQCMAMPLDVTQEASVQGFVDQLLNRFGRLDCAANSAGFILNGSRPMAEYSLADFEKVFSVNFFGVMLSMRAQIPAMKGEGAIVNIASAAALIGTPGLAPYTASKHAVLGLTRTAACDYAAKGVRINALCPGYVRTPMSGAAVAEMSEEQRKAIMSSAPIGRISEPEEQADAVLFLCSDRSSYLVGHGLVVDGGYSVI